MKGTRASRSSLPRHEAMEPPAPTHSVDQVLPHSALDGRTEAKGGIEPHVTTSEPNNQPRPRTRPAKAGKARTSDQTERNSHDRPTGASSGSEGSATAVAPAATPPPPGKAAPGAPSGHSRPDAGQGVPASGSPSLGGSGFPAGLPDFDRLAHNIGLLVEESGKVVASLMKPREAPAPSPSKREEVADMVATLGQVAGSWLADPGRALRAQAALSAQFVDLWLDGVARLSGDAPARSEPARITDKRFAAPEWRQVPFFDFLRQAYLISTDWANSMVEGAEDVDPETREKARFYLRQVSSAVSPSNFLFTNPELLRDTVDQNGENLVRGMRMLAEDIEAGHGDLKIRQSDPSPFKLGVNMAVTPGKVVFRNELMELIQYAPTTPDVYQRPLLIVPPWINKFYVLDLNPEKSFVRWAVEQGLTVFVISWVNPDARHADKGFEAYMREGILGALEAIERATGERDVATIGYCVGGTLLAVTLAFMAAGDDDRISSATFFTAQTDFQDAGDLKVFAGEDHIRALEAQMEQDGYLKGAKMANAFNMLRPNELIWSYVVNNYLKGKAPAAFDLLTWNADSTRMPAANHAFYLRNCYLENKLTKGEMVIGGERLDLGKITVPVYNLATREDHIAPARSVFTGAKFFGGPMRYVLAGSGHIAGVVNPPAKAKYQFWEGPPVEGSFEEWLAAAVEHPGTWWPDWLAWLTAQSPARVPARVPGEGQLPALCDAPGEYVRVQS